MKKKAWGEAFEKESYWAGLQPPLRQWIWNMGLMLSQCANTVIGGCPDESISSRLGRAQADPDASKWVKTIAEYVDKVFGFEHCRSSAEKSIYIGQEVWSWSKGNDVKYTPQFSLDDPRNDLREFLSEEEYKKFTT